VQQKKVTARHGGLPSITPSISSLPA